MNNQEFIFLAYHQYMKMDEEPYFALVELLEKLEQEKYLKRVDKH